MTTKARAPIARRRVDGRCQDCGRDTIPTRVVTFWVNGMRYRVCKEHEQAYRGVICWPVYERKGA